MSFEKSFSIAAHAHARLYTLCICYANKIGVTLPGRIFSVKIDYVKYAPLIIRLILSRAMQRNTSLQHCVKNRCAFVERDCGYGRRSSGWLVVTIFGTGWREVSWLWRCRRRSSEPAGGSGPCDRRRWCISEGPCTRPAVCPCCRSTGGARILYCRRLDSAMIHHTTII